MLLRVPASVKNYIWNASYQVLLVLVPLITVPYVSRVLGPTQVGVYSYTYSIANYFVLFITLGMNQYGIREIARAGANKSTRSKAFWSMWFSQLLIGVPVACVYFIYSSINPAGGKFVAWTWGLWVISAVLDTSWLFFGVENFRMPTIRNFVTKVIGVAFIIGFCRDSGDLWAYVFGLAISYILNAFLLLPFLHHYVDFYKPSIQEVLRHFIPNLRLFAPVVAISLYTSLDKMLLGLLSTMRETGYFEYSDKIARIPLSLVTALGTVMLPHMTSKLASGERETALSILADSLWFMEAVAFGLTFGIAAIAPEFPLAFFGPGYDRCAYVMPIVGLIIPIVSASNVIGVQYMLPVGMDKQYTKSVFVGSAVNIVVCLILLKPFGAVGAAVATAVTELSVLMYQIRVVKGELPVASYMLPTIPFALCGILMFVCVRFFSCWTIDFFGNTWMQLLLEILVGLVAYWVLAVVVLFKSGRLDRIQKMIHS